MKYSIALLTEFYKDRNLPVQVFQRFQQTQDFVSQYSLEGFPYRVTGVGAASGQSVNSLAKSAQQIGESLQKTAYQATSRAVDTVTTTFDQAKASIQQTLQSAEQVKNTTSVVLQTAISSAVDNWFEQHPILLRLVQILGWAANHPFISVIILLFALAVVWSLIKAIGRIIESTSLSLLQVPFKLLQALVKVSFVSFTTVSSLAVKQRTDTKTIAHTPTVLPSIPLQIRQEKQQKLVKIFTRLEEIQKEQNHLLEEAAEILASEKIDVGAHIEQSMK